MINYRPSWLDSDLGMYRDTVYRFIDKEMAPLDEEARERGNVGHELWLKAGALFSVRTSRAHMAAAEAIFGTKRSFNTKRSFKMPWRAAA